MSVLYKFLAALVPLDSRWQMSLRGRLCKSVPSLQGEGRVALEKISSEESKSSGLQEFRALSKSTEPFGENTENTRMQVSQWGRGYKAFNGVTVTIPAHGI